jgi:hypothetical protein
VKLFHRLLMNHGSRPLALAHFLLLAVSSLLATPARTQTYTPTQHFVCNTGYTLKQCQEGMAVLRQVLARYPAADLGEWTWFLVRPEDWRFMLLKHGFNPDRSPAFTILDKRETFFEGALVKRESSRGVQLRNLWRMPVEDLLDLAVCHEIAHALCNERNETKTRLAATALKQGKPLSCQATLVAKQSGAKEPTGERRAPQ